MCLTLLIQEVGIWLDRQIHGVFQLIYIHDTTQKQSNSILALISGIWLHINSFSKPEHQFMKLQLEKWHEEQQDTFASDKEPKYLLIAGCGGKINKAAFPSLLHWWRHRQTLVGSQWRTETAKQLWHCLRWARTPVPKGRGMAELEPAKASETKSHVNKSSNENHSDKRSLPKQLINRKLIFYLVFFSKWVCSCLFLKVYSAQTKTDNNLFHLVQSY